MADDDACKDGVCDGETMCFKHKIRTVQLSPAATPSRRNNIPPSRQGEGNSWEKGIATDERGMPLIGKNGYIGLKEMQDRRHDIESQLRQMHNAPSSPASNTKEP